MLFRKFRYSFTCAFLLLLSLPAVAQSINASTLFARQTLYAERLKRREGLFKYTIVPLLNQPPDTLNEFQFKTAMWNISQYLLTNDTTRRLIDTLFNHYPALETATRRSLLEVVYGLYPTEYTTPILHYWPQETDDRLLAVMAVYLKRINGLNPEALQKKLLQNRAYYDSSAVLQQVVRYFSPPANEPQPAPVSSLFQHQKMLGCKVIYAFQRADRNFPGLAIVQNADGSFVKDSLTGQLKTFVQLARSAANLPYFITNGSTPQGIYRIHGTGISVNGAIGPTPNIQMLMPYEATADSFFLHPGQPLSGDAAFLEAYKQLLPAGWHTAGMLESFYAGKCGRGAIIAHGTTLDPWYYQGQAFYPCTPTLGCLCAKEIWNPNTGRLIQSDQVDLVNAFLATPGTDGYLFVVNMDNKKNAVTPEEIMALVKDFESK